MRRKTTFAMISREVAVTGQIVALVMTLPSYSFVETFRKADVTESFVSLRMLKNQRSRRSMMSAEISKSESANGETIADSSTSAKMMIHPKRFAKISKMVAVLEETNVDSDTLMSLPINRSKWPSLVTFSMILG